MVDGYLMIVYSIDGSSATDGGIEFWDVSNPRSPVRVHQYDNADTHGLVEAHGFGLARIGARSYMAAQSVRGIQIWDVTEAANVFLTADLTLPGVHVSDYAGVFWLFWQAPYVYVAGTNAGLYIVDASDPYAPFLVEQVPTGQLGGFSPGEVFALGNLLVVTELRGGIRATYDIGIPDSPSLLDLVSGAKGYSHLFAAGKILTSGGEGSLPRTYVADVGMGGSSNGEITLRGSVGSGLGNGGYGSYQDGFFLSGFSTKVAKFDVAALTQLGTASSGLAGRDEDFGQVLGNLLFAGDDHGVGSALIVHDLAPDTLGPRVERVHPTNGATLVPTSGRVGLAMSDNVLLDSLGASTFVVRPVGGAKLSGTYNVQMSLVNFAPDHPLLPGTTYEVVTEGLRDWAGNLGPRFESRFTTSGASAPTCSIAVPSPEEVGSQALLEAEVAGGTPPLSYSWQFGDGTSTPPTLSPSAMHSYSSAGRYTVELTVTDAVLRTTGCAAVQIVHLPLTSSPPSGSSSLVQSGDVTYVVNPDNDTVTAVRTGSTARTPTGAGERQIAVLWEVAVGRQPKALALVQAPQDGEPELWVVEQGDATISVLDPATGALRRQIDLPYASQPVGLVTSPSGSAVYISLHATRQVLRMTPGGAITAVRDLEATPRGLAVSADSEQVLVTRFRSNATNGRVWALEAHGLALSHVIDLAFDPGPDTEGSGRGVPNYLSQLRISPDGQVALVPSKKDNVARGLFRDGNPLTFESRTRTIVSSIDLGSGAELPGRRMDLNDRDMAQAVAWSPLGDVFAVATLGSNHVELYERFSQRLLASVETGLAPQALVFSSDGARLIVHNYLSRSLSVFDTSELTRGVSHQVALLAEVDTVAQERLAANVLLGKQIFYNASDPRMSRDGYLSCASCHLDGGHDSQIWDFTQVGEGLRNTISLRGRGVRHGRLHWTANFDEVQDFENDIRFGFGGTGFLSDSDFDTTEDPLGPAKAGRSVELDALAAYVRSLIRFPKSPYRLPIGSGAERVGVLTPEAVLGRQLFQERGCNSCHSGPEFLDGERHDVGTVDDSSGLGLGVSLVGVGFETPTLKGLWDSAPYLHNGAAASLEEVLANPLHGNTSGLSASQRAPARSVSLADRRSAVH